MYLSRLYLNPRSRQVQRELADAYQLHRTVMSAFPAALPAEERVLYRLEIDPRSRMPFLLVQSQNRPDWSRLSGPDKTYLLPAGNGAADGGNPAVKEVNLRLNPGQMLVFRLSANPTKKVKADGKKNGSRVALLKEEDQIRWLQRKLSVAGVGLIEARINQKEQAAGWLSHGDRRGRLQLVIVRFEGVLQVKDPESLIEAVQSGIGSGKGFGCGLLSLAPFRN